MYLNNKLYLKVSCKLLLLTVKHECYNHNHLTKYHNC